jgi:hypothetical protein
VSVADEGKLSKPMIDRLFWGCAAQDFPTERFDDISKMPKLWPFVPIRATN